MILAMTNGLPVVAARQPAYVELLGDGDAGWLYRVRERPRARRGDDVGSQ